MRKIRLDSKGLSGMVAVIVLLTLVLVLGAIIAGTLSGAPRPVMPAVTALNLTTPLGGNPAAGDTTLIIGHEYGQVIDDAYVSKAGYGDDTVYWGKMVMLINGEKVEDAKWHPGEEPIVVVFPGTKATLATDKIRYTAVEVGAAGNEISVAYIDPGTGGQSLRVEVENENKFIKVYLATQYFLATLTTGTEENQNRVTYTAKPAYGGPPGNEISIEYVENTGTDTLTTVSVVENAITVHIGTKAGENTTVKVASAVNAHSVAKTLVTATAETVPENLRPNGAGTYQEWETLVDTSHWGATSDVSDATYIQTVGSSAKGDVQHLQDPTFPETAAIESVEVFVRAYAIGSHPAERLYILEKGLVKERTTSKTITRGVWADYSTGAKTTAPDGGAWTWEKVRDLQVGVKVQTLATGETLRVSEIWVVVKYGNAVDFPFGPENLSGGDLYEIYGNSVDSVKDAVNTHPDAGKLVVASVISTGHITAPMARTYLSGGVDIVYQETFDLGLGDMMVIDLATPLQSSDLIQLLWEPRDLMLVEYLVQ